MRKVITMAKAIKWQKRGLIVGPQDAGGWAKSHAQVPTPLVCDGFVRIYFSSRPERGISLTTFVDVDMENPARILRRHKPPILELGRPGTFDEHGIMPGCAVRQGDRVFLYYSGWSRSVSVPYTNSTGLAISDDGGETFQKLSEGPILSRSIRDPFSATSPAVLKVGAKWHMWYCSGTKWLKIHDKFQHTYDIKYARSSDGMSWVPSGQVVIGQRTDDEAITRPFVLKSADGYHMWFCFRGSHDFRDGIDSYRIGYAYSEDMQRWHRDDEKAGIDPSDAGWDSKMVAYPSVVMVNNRMLMFYNGNDFGADGFGYAVLET